MHSYLKTVLLTICVIAVSTYGLWAADDEAHGVVDKFLGAAVSSAEFCSARPVHYYVLMKKAQNANERLDWSYALELYKRIIEDCNVPTSYRVPAAMQAMKMYYLGCHGVDANYAQALDYAGFVLQNREYMLPKNYVELAFYIAQIYLKGGFGVEKNYRIAHAHFTYVINDPHASYMEKTMSYLGLGELWFEGGFGVEKNYGFAGECFAFLVNSGRVPYAEQVHASLRLGLINYFGGFGIMQNHDVARRCFEKVLRPSYVLPEEYGQDYSLAQEYINRMNEPVLQDD